MVALIDLAHGSLEAAEPGDPGRWRWARTIGTAAIATGAAAVVVLAAATATRWARGQDRRLGALSACLPCWSSSFAAEVNRRSPISPVVSPSVTLRR